MLRILVMNLGGSTSKVAIFEDKECVAEKSLLHSPEEMAANPLSKQQVEYRTKMIKDWLDENGYKMEDIDAIAMRATAIKQAVHGGTYHIADRYRELALKAYHPDEKPIHGTRFAVPIAEALMGDKKIPMYVTDPGGATDLPDMARITGFKDVLRYPTGHPLNQKMVARKHAEKLGKPYKDCNFIVVHLGSGISVGAHSGGKIIEMNGAAGGWGPMSPIRAGTVECNTMVNLCYDYGYTKSEAMHKYRSEAGILSHLGTNDMREVEKRIAEGDEYADLVYEAMAYQIATEIGARVASLYGVVDAILITGAIAHSQNFVGRIGKYVEKIAPVVAYPGEFENEALALGAYRVMTGEEDAQQIDESIIAE